MREISNAERRSRLAVRHALHPDHRSSGPVEAARAMTVLHATEPASVYLSVQARHPETSTSEIERALYTDRTLVKQLAMRRTLFAFPLDLLPAAWGSASARVAAAHRARLVKDLELHGVAADGAAWLERAEAAVLETLASEESVQTADLKRLRPELAGRFHQSVGKKYEAKVSVVPRVLTQMAVEGRLVRGENAGHWRTSRPRWTLMSRWLDEVPDALEPADGYRELVRRWLRSFGPGTESDLVWWLGSTKAAVRTALAELDAVQVRLEDSGVGWVLPDDVDPVDDPGEWTALLPVLDPTIMGWKERAWYLEDRGPYLFDSVGNAGATCWVNGRAVGAWAQDPEGVVRISLLEPVTASQRRSLEAQAERLTRWLDGVVVGTVYPSTAMKELRAEPQR